ncbi:MAG: hypothetical protein JWN69_2179 [Alphaproteobacteria bacterium]|nr:hypothetical protein [Alphaproteobacteria bacterium]
MKAFFAGGCALLLASLAGCTTTGKPSASVTRFHLGQPIARGQIAVEAADPGTTAGLEYRTYAAAVERQLARLGWSVVQSVGQSEQVALIDVRRGSREMLDQRGPVSVGVGGSTGGWGSGVGVGVGFNLGGGGSRERIGTMLSVRIKRRSDGTVFWEGRAMSEARADSPEADPAATVERLAEAMFRDFPGESGRTIRVR